MENDERMKAIFGDSDSDSDDDLIPSGGVAQQKEFDVDDLFKSDSDSDDEPAPPKKAAGGGRLKKGKAAAVRRASFLSILNFIILHYSSSCSSFHICASTTD
jgi:hypothetical protein